MSGLPYQGGMNSYMFDTSQYGVSMPSQVNTSAATGLSSIVPFIGPLLGAGMNMLAQYSQNQMQKQMFEDYMSPQARMAQMRAAGINPNAASQGISGSSAPQMNAAAPTNAYSGLGEQLGNSVNTALTADAIKAGIRKTDAETELTDSLNTGKQIENKYADAMQNATLKKLVSDGTISEHQANIIAIDDYYHGAEAAAHLEQTYLTIEQMSATLQNTQQEYFNLLAQEYATMQAGQLSEAQIHKVFSDIGLNNAQIEKIAHETENIDASTMAITQSISESQARERLTRAQAQYSEKVYNTWRDSGWNVNSDVNSNFQRLCMEGKIDQAKTILNGTKAMILNEGEARFRSKDYMFDKSVDIIGHATRLAGFSMMSGSVKGGLTLQTPTASQTEFINTIGRNPTIYTR